MSPVHLSSVRTKVVGLIPVRQGIWSTLLLSTQVDFRYDANVNVVDYALANLRLADILPMEWSMYTIMCGITVESMIRMIIITMQSAYNVILRAIQICLNYLEFLLDSSILLTIVTFIDSENAPLTPPKSLFDLQCDIIHLLHVLLCSW